MEFLTECARVASTVNMPLRWTTPLGFPVWQDYRAHTDVMVPVFIDGRRHRVAVRQEHRDPHAYVVDKRQAVSGVVPNFVHSLDSSHLMWTVLRAHADGIEDFVMVHDSFCTHATGLGVLARELRIAFTSMYERPFGPRVDWLERFRAETAERVAAAGGGKLPEVPPKGDFRVAEVGDSLYFFA
jgi:DNA-directed RNA polymerase